MSFWMVVIAIGALAIGIVAVARARGGPSGGDRI